MPFSARFRDGGEQLAFTAPLDVLRSTTARETREALDRCERALADGRWIAGELRYDGSAVLGIFAGPFSEANAPRDAAFAISPLLPLVEPEAYARAVTCIQDDIRDGEVYQVNYTVPFALAVDGDALAAWEAVAARTAAGYQAFLEDGERRVLSWSPELFLAFDGDTVRTKPMKGTAPAGRHERLLEAKNRAEHVMIVDLLRNDLQRAGRNVRVERLCTVERYPSFATMTSTIAADIAGVSLGAVIDATFPCGSITGAPKRAAMARIARLELRPRDSYCGAIGFLGPGRRGWWNVAIRTAQLEGRLGRFDAGGGIVSDSHASDEWNEIETKAAFLRTHAQPLELWETLAADASDTIVERHLNRLRTSATRFRVPLDSAAIRAAIRAARSPDALLRIRLRADGGFEVLRDPLERPADPAPVLLARECVDSRDPWLQIKSAWRPAHRRAFEAARAHGCFDALLINERGELTEGTRTTLFVELDGALWTPPLSCGVLPGVLREQLIEQGVARERTLRADDLARASATYVGNSARGLLRARIISP